MLGHLIVWATNPSVAAPMFGRKPVGVRPCVRRDPTQLWLVRHGQSEGNVARDQAHKRNAEVLDIAQRDMDVPLSKLGRQQSYAFGRWLAVQDEQPDVVIASPYVRAVETAELIARA